MGLFNNLLGFGNIQKFLVESKSVDGFVIRGLVPTEEKETTKTDKEPIMLYQKDSFCYSQTTEKASINKEKEELTGTILGYQP